MIVWYGPHSCPNCGRTVIVKTGNGAPPLALDSEDHDHHYPNFHWHEHQCWAIDTDFDTRRLEQLERAYEREHATP